MNTLQERWEGVSLPGDYHLERWLSGNGIAGFFETPVAADGRRTVVKLVTETAVNPAGQLALWQRTRQLRHPNLQELLDCGRAELAGETVLYAVFEAADDSLSSVLAKGPLSEAEAREVLEAVLGGLGCLQSEGLGLAGLEPQHVVAVGERIKLSTDALCDVAPGTRDTAQARALRAFWYKISPCTAARSADILSKALGENAPTADGAAISVAPEPAAAASRSVDLAAPQPKSFPKWIMAGAAGVVLLILGMNYRRTPEAAPTQPTAQIATVPKTSDAPVAAPKATAPAIKTGPSRKAKDKPSPLGKGQWRVIVFTFRTRDGATRKADQLNQRHPELAATVISSRGKNGSFAISLGGPMSRADAERMEKRARAAHVARDVRLDNGLN